MLLCLWIAVHVLFPPPHFQFLENWDIVQYLNLCWVEVVVEPVLILQNFKHFSRSSFIPSRAKKGRYIYGINRLQICQLPLPCLLQPLVQISNQSCLCPDFWVSAWYSLPVLELCLMSEHRIFRNIKNESILPSQHWRNANESLVFNCIVPELLGSRILFWRI